jgi:hypothetical protein
LTDLRVICKAVSKTEDINDLEIVVIGPDSVYFAGAPAGFYRLEVAAGFSV